MKGIPGTVKESAVAGLILVAALLLAGCGSTPARPGDDAVSGASQAGRDMPSIADDIAPEERADRILVVYFSQGSAVKRVAEDIATLLGADTERIVERKARTGLFGFLGAGADSSRKRSSDIEAPARDPSGYDTVIACTPVWAWSLSPPVRAWLTLMKGRLPPCAFIVVSAATAPEKVVAMMEGASGVEATAYAGFIQKDFDARNRAAYAGKIRDFIAGLR